MLSLRDLLSVAGLVSGKELITLYGAELDFEELMSMVKNKEVSVHVEPMGGKNYRYPYYEPKTKENGAERMFEAIRDRPWMNAKTIREILEISQASFERWEAELLQEGRITRTKKGVAWLYTVNDLEKPEKPEKVPKGAWYIWHEYSQPDSGGKSLQQLAKSYRCSREVITEGHKWMVDQGILVGEDLVGFKAMSVDERKAWLKKTFPRRGGDQEGWEDEYLDYCCSDEEVMRKKFHDSTAATLAQPSDDLEQSILSTLGNKRMTVAEIAEALPHHQRSEIRDKVLSMCGSSLTRDWWPQNEDNPALFSRKNRV